MRSSHRFPAARYGAHVNSGNVGESGEVARTDGCLLLPAHWQSGPGTTGRVGFDTGRARMYASIVRFSRPLPGVTRLAHRRIWLEYPGHRLPARGGAASAPTVPPVKRCRSHLYEGVASADLYGR